MSERLVDPAVTESGDAALRPGRLTEFVGQAQVRENLGVFVAAAAMRGEALDHVLLSGPPGLGKTTLAQIIARELGVNFKSTSGPVIARVGDLAAQLTNLEPRDVLFIDEIHRLSPVVEEFLYPALEDFRMDIMIGEGPAARSINIELPRFTLVGATTRAGLLTKPLHDRFGIQLRLQFYEPAELRGIIERQAVKLSLELTPEGADEIAKRARGTPRVAGRLLRRVRDFCAVDGGGAITRASADKALGRLEVDARGLDAMDRRYLLCIAKTFEGGPVGVETLAAALADQRDVLEEVIEPFLMQQGLIMRTPRGRILAPDGWRSLSLSPPKGLEKQLDLLALDPGIDPDG